GVTDAGRLDLHHHLAGLGAVELHGLHLQRLARLERHGRTHIHRRSPRSIRREQGSPASPKSPAMIMCDQRLGVKSLRNDLSGEACMNWFRPSVAWGAVAALGAILVALTAGVPARSQSAEP